jgi:hypothetical protein
MRSKHTRAQVNNTFAQFGQQYFPAAPAVGEKRSQWRGMEAGGE